MASKITHYLGPVFTFITSVLVSAPALAQDATTSHVPTSWFIYTIVLVVLLGSLLAVLFVRNALSGSSWSLANALSEEAEVTAMEIDPKTHQKMPVLDSSGKPLMVTELVASSSRLVALMGMMVILFMFLGFGTFVLISFAKTGNLPSSVDKIVKFLVAGMTLFAPYAVNKFASIFESISPGKP